MTNLKKNIEPKYPGFITNSSLDTYKDIPTSIKIKIAEGEALLKIVGLPKEYYDSTKKREELDSQNQVIPLAAKPSKPTKIKRKPTKKTTKTAKI
jgi:hypothetical protein